jgi:hypothetical protein
MEVDDIDDLDDGVAGLDLSDEELLGGASTRHRPRSAPRKRIEKARMFSGYEGVAEGEELTFHEENTITTTTSTTTTTTNTTSTTNTTNTTATDTTVGFAPTKVKAQTADSESQTSISGPPKFIIPSLALAHVVPGSLLDREDEDEGGDDDIGNGVVVERAQTVTHSYTHAQIKMQTQNYIYT